MLDWLIDGINSFKNLEPNIVNMLGLPYKSAYPVSRETPLFANAFKQIEAFVNKGFEKPNEIIDKFKEYAFLLAKTSDEVVDSFLGNKEKDKKKRKSTKNDKSVEELDKYLEKVNDSIKVIQGLCINEKNTHFF